MIKRRLFPRSLSECIAPVADPILKGNGKLTVRVLRDWQQIAGAELAALAQPDGIRFPRDAQADGVLTVSCAPAHALDVQYREPLLLEKLAVYFGYRAITRIRIKQVHSPAAPPPRKILQKCNPTPLCATIEDDALRGALTRLAQALQSDRK